MNITIREMKKSEYPLLREFLYEAIYVPAGETAPSKEVLNLPELQIYYADFGDHCHDFALVAEDGGSVIGAVWNRIMHDYGHVDDFTPSLSISLYKEYRNRGIGRMMLNEMLGCLKMSGYEKVSLSVQKINYATNLYLDMGFKIVGENEEDYIMIYELR
ncbi:MAG: N-acetyltransferase [Clostridia bacterium]|nr:N-acetyltransferase [Clostridia bacterium]